ncbi:MAG: SRPBCC family protein [Roseiflexaceae bacterium]
MGKPEFVYVSYIATTPERLWAALTKGEFTKTYWYGRRIESQWTVGAPVAFFDGDSQDLTDSGVVLISDPPRQLVYTFRNEFDPAARQQGYSRVSFTLEPHEGVVKLTLVHDELPDEQTAIGFREGWSPILSSLKTFLETGKPLPQLRSLEERGRPPREERG